MKKPNDHVEPTKVDAKKKKEKMTTKQVQRQHGPVSREPDL